MGKRTTKGGRILNPADAYRKKLRKKEIKKNKVQRKKVRDLILATKNPDKIRQQINDINRLESSGKAEKRHKAKKKQLLETLEKVLARQREIEKEENPDLVLDDNSRERQSLEREDLADSDGQPPYPYPTTMQPAAFVGLPPVPRFRMPPGAPPMGFPIEEPPFLPPQDLPEMISTLPPPPLTNFPPPPVSPHPSELLPAPPPGPPPDDLSNLDSPEDINPPPPPPLPPNKLDVEPPPPPPPLPPSDLPSSNEGGPTAGGNWPSRVVGGGPHGFFHPSQQSYPPGPFPPGPFPPIIPPPIPGGYYGGPPANGAGMVKPPRGMVVDNTGALSGVVAGGLQGMTHLPDMALSGSIVSGAPMVSIVSALGVPRNNPNIPNNATAAAAAASGAVRKFAGVPTSLRVRRTTTPVQISSSSLPQYPQSMVNNTAAPTNNRKNNNNNSQIGGYNETVSMPQAVSVTPALPVQDDEDFEKYMEEMKALGAC